MQFGYFSRRTILHSALAAIIAVSLPALAMAQGNGGGKKGGGGDVEPSFPTFPTHPDLEYQVTLINPPTGYQSSAYARAFSDNGCAIGNYEHVEDGIQTTQTWFFDPLLFENQAIDLRTLLNVQLPDGAEVLARGINDFGMVVGGIIYANGDIDGFALDTLTGELELLPTDPNWSYALGMEINNNGDILGQIWYLDGTIGNYLYNPGAGELDPPTLEFVNVPDITGSRSHLNHAINGETTTVVGRTDDGRLFIHPKGGETEITDFSSWEAHINDSGTVSGGTSATFEVQVRKNKTETVMENRFYRMTDTDGFQVLDSLPYFSTEDTNNSEVAVGRHTETVSTESGTNYKFYVMAHFADHAVIDIGGSVTDADKALWDLLGNSTNGLAINNLGPEGHPAGQIIGTTDADEIFLLTPVLK